MWVSCTGSGMGSADASAQASATAKATAQAIANAVAQATNNNAQVRPPRTASGPGQTFYAQDCLHWLGCNVPYAALTFCCWKHRHPSKQLPVKHADHSTVLTLKR